MSKPTLKINDNDIENTCRTLGLTELLVFLRDSNLFSVEYHNERIKAGKGQRATLLYYNDKKVYLDLWEYSMPTYTMQTYNANPDLIIKLQHRPMLINRFEKVCSRKKMLQTLTPEQRKEYLRKIARTKLFWAK